MRTLALIFVAVLAVPSLYGAEPCKLISGRAHKYSDGNLRIWHIGTHHEYEPADEPSGALLEKWIEAGVSEDTKSKSAIPLTSVNLFADFLICPTEPFKKGSVQHAQVKSLSHRRYIRLF